MQVSWETSADLKEGTFQLENGHRQTVTIEDGKLEILEYDQDRLVKSVKGTISGDTVLLDTELYDKSGDVTQSIHAEMNRMENSTNGGMAQLERQVKWFKNGELSGEMQDSMMLTTSITFADPPIHESSSEVKKLLNTAMSPVADDVETASRKITDETHSTYYYANIREYDGNKTLRRSIIVENDGTFGQKSNHSDLKVKGLLPRSTTETFHKTNLQIQIQDYDAEGKILRDASFSDKQIDSPLSDKGKQKQTLDVSWYNKGELTKKTHGSMSVQKTNTHSLQKRPGITELLGLSSESYLGDAPQAAFGMVGQRSMEIGSEPDFFMEGLEKHANEGDYNRAKGMGNSGPISQPYSIEWTDELYKDGKLTLRKSDTEEAKKLSAYKRLQGQRFFTGHGLTEDARPLALHSHSHTLETFQDGKLTSRRHVESRESLKENSHSPDKLISETSVEQIGAGKNFTTSTKAHGGFDNKDITQHNAAKHFGKALQLTLDDMVETVASLDREEDVKEGDRHVTLYVEPLGFPDYLEL
ncbi:hypothetical protein [uncultured Pseudodesulfovibrio sp.]|uniref:hypothetical protein n=1 Tax=uncultured Pseudodesulfovibrio sp. TaxID=2035858 RepID=UPI0029C66E96|nr:hypothetical protein [uncultured Pseudodesulfovibrio sp.]